MIRFVIGRSRSRLVLCVIDILGRECVAQSPFASGTRSLIVGLRKKTCALIGQSQRKSDSILDWSVANRPGRVRRYKCTEPVCDRTGSGYDSLIDRSGGGQNRKCIRSVEIGTQSVARRE